MISISQGCLVTYQSAFAKHGSWALQTMGFRNILLKYEWINLTLILKAALPISSEKMSNLIHTSNLTKNEACDNENWRVHVSKVYTFNEDIYKNYMISISISPDSWD